MISLNTDLICASCRSESKLLAAVKEEWAERETSKKRIRFSGVREMDPHIDTY